MACGRGLAGPYRKAGIAGRANAAVRRSERIAIPPLPTLVVKWIGLLHAESMESRHVLRYGLELL